MQTRIKISQLVFLLLAAFSGYSQVPDTIVQTKNEFNVKYRAFELNPSDLIITLPGSVIPINLGQHAGRTYQPLGIVEGFHIWGVARDSSYCYRLVMTQYTVGLEVFWARQSLTLRFGNDHTGLYLMEEPLEITEFKVRYHLRMIEGAKALLLRLIQKKFPTIEELYCPSIPMPYRQ